MPTLRCENCGGKFSALSASAEFYCNLGCAVRQRVPVDGSGNFPVNRSLIGALVVGLLFFNQLLAAGLSALLEHRERLALSVRWAWISIVLSLLVWLATMALQRFEGVSRGKDHVVSGVVLAILLASIWKTEPRIGLVAAASAVLLVWNFRGLIFHQRVKTETRR